MTKPPQPDGHGHPPPIARRELVLLAAVVLLGAALRFAWPSRLAVEHFDEGVYASNIWFGEESHFRYPARHLYAPPLFPALIEWSIILLGTGGLSVKLASLLAGTATIALVWLTARRWFGREAGIAAAVLAALSDFHILYSRLALTDVLMCLFLLAAVYAVHEMFARPSHGWAIAAGLATGLCWATKYNGWLPLAIAVSGIVFYAIVRRWKRIKPDHTWMNAAVSLLLMTLTAAVVWSPVWFDLQNRGGYAAVADNHRGYVGGFSEWWPSLVRQVNHHRQLEGWLSIVSPLCAMAAAIPACWQCTKKADGRRIQPLVSLVVCLALSTSAAIIGSTSLLGVLTVIAVLLTHLRPAAGNKRLSYSLLTVWFIGLFLATPFYHPYPRLTLPWLVAMWLGGGAMVGEIVRAMSNDAMCAGTRSIPRNYQWILVAVVLANCTSIVTLSKRWHDRGIPAWQSQTGLQTAAAEITTVLPQSDALVEVYAEPALFYELAAAADSRYAVVPIGSLEPSAQSPSVPTYLVTGPNAHREQNHAAAIAAYGDRLELIAEYPYRPSQVILLNWIEAKPSRDQSVRLYLLR